MNDIDTERVVLESSTEVGDDELEHWICPICFPGYEPTKKVVTLCGLIDYDQPPSDVDVELLGLQNCVVCVNVECDVCGYKFIDSRKK